MLRSVAGRLGSAFSHSVRSNVQGNCAVVSVRLSHDHGVSHEEFVDQYIQLLSQDPADKWTVRKTFNDLAGEDVVPEPKIIIAAMKACRALNDHSLAVRFLESTKHKCGPHAKDIWPYLMQEVGPTLKELGISTPEELGYDKPELACQNIYDIH